MLQQAFPDGPTLVEFADEVVFAGDGVVKKRLAKRRLARNETNRSHRDAVLMHVHQHETNPLVFGDIGIGSNERKYPIRVLSTRCPNFLTVDNKMVAFVFCSGT